MSDMQDDDIVDGEFDSVEFASYIYQQARAQGLRVNATKLQKWLYICYGLYLVRNNRHLINERPKAWPYGPVFPRLHKAFNPNLSITKLNIDINKEHDLIVSNTLRLFGKWTATRLSNWTHQAGSAWADTRMQYEKFNTPIADELIRRDFTPITRIRDE